MKAETLTNYASVELTFVDGTEEGSQLKSIGDGAFQSCANNAPE